MKLNGVWIGDFDTKVVIESQVKTRNATTSEEEITWQTFATAWANRNRKSNESFEVQKQVANETGDWVIRYIAGIDETMRVNDHGMYHYIKSIQRVDRNSILVLMTEKRDG